MPVYFGKAKPSPRLGGSCEGGVGGCSRAEKDEEGRGNEEGGGVEDGMGTLTLDREMLRRRDVR